MGATASSVSQCTYDVPYCTCMACTAVSRPRPPASLGGRALKQAGPVSLVPSDLSPVLSVIFPSL
jgi:hypothetical protein